MKTPSLLILFGCSSEIMIWPCNCIFPLSAGLRSKLRLIINESADLARVKNMQKKYTHQFLILFGLTLLPAFFSFSFNSAFGLESKITAESIPHPDLTKQFNCSPNNDPISQYEDIFLKASEDNKRQNQTPENKSNDAGSPPENEEEFTVSDIHSTLEDVRPASVSEFLGLDSLPRSMKKNFLPLKHATRLQPASPSRPRVILYSDDIRLLMTFNGGLSGTEDHGAFNQSIEVMQFNGETKKYDFYTFRINPDKTFTSAGPNPQECVHCHIDQDPFFNYFPHKVLDNKQLDDFIMSIKAGTLSDIEALNRYRQFDWDTPPITPDFRELHRKLIKN